MGLASEKLLLISVSIDFKMCQCFNIANDIARIWCDGVRGLRCRSRRLGENGESIIPSPANYRAKDKGSGVSSPSGLCGRASEENENDFYRATLC